MSESRPARTPHYLMYANAASGFANLGQLEKAKGFFEVALEEAGQNPIFRAAVLCKRADAWSGIRGKSADAMIDLGRVDEILANLNGNPQAERAREVWAILHDKITNAQELPTLTGVPVSDGATSDTYEINGWPITRQFSEEHTGLGAILRIVAHDTNSSPIMPDASQADTAEFYGWSTDQITQKRQSPGWEIVNRDGSS